MASITRTVRQNVVALVTALARARGVSVGQISKEYYGNGSFIQEFRTGQASISVDKLDTMIQAIADAWPDGTAWPYLRTIVMPAPRPKRRPRRKILPKRT